MQVKKTEYYLPRETIYAQIKDSSKKRNISKFKFILRKIRNYICEILAYKCPINSVRIKLHKYRGVKIGKKVMIGMEVILDHAYPEYIIIEDDCGLAGYDYILTHSTPRSHFENILNSYIANVVIKKGAFIGIGVIILPGVTIGEYSIISAGSVVNKDVPPYSIVAGNPAKLISNFNKELLNITER